MNTLKLTRDQLTCLIGKEVPPVAETTLPARITFETINVFRDALQKETDTLDELDYDTINPATGPVKFTNLKAGDVLVVKINKVKCISPAAAIVCPNEGVMGDQIEKGITRIYHWDKDDNVEIKGGFKLKATPMIGVMGVAPAGKGIRTIEPGDHGGNLDTTLLKEGATVYLPVQVDGGIFSVGDLHEAQGDGESWYTGLEASGEVELEFSIRNDMKIDIPFVKSAGVFASLASDATTDGALKKAMTKLINFIVDNGKLDFYEAGFVCGLFADLGICQVVDPLKTCRMSISLDNIKDLLNITL
ncbi:MAG: acetamidase/formamidase family protein [Clostridiales Family XIII bacterium]|jgi:amidase|nr:acetamidase/formamidase family protein [Clostridiales Family XIII bacterium]